MRRTILLMLVVVAMGAGWHWREHWLPRAASETAVADVAPVIPPIEPPVAVRLAKIDARLRLPPDRRALAAIGEIRRLVHGSAPVEVVAEYASGSWRITLDGDLIGMLSDFPRFAALLSLLDEQASKEGREPGARVFVDEIEVRPELQTLLTEFDDASAFEVLRQVDARWVEGRASVGDLIAASDALAQLCALLPRDSAAADRLAARALAALTLARQRFADRTVRAEVTLAFALGYASHAHALAESLPREEPLAAFVRNDLEALERASRPADASHVDPLYGARLLWWRGDDAWRKWYEALPEKRASRAIVVGSALDDRGAWANDFAAERYAALLLDRFDVPLGGSCGSLSEKLAQRARGFGGPFVDAALFTDLYLSACQSALERAKHKPAMGVDTAALDSRASARLVAGELARDTYRDPGLEDRLLGAAVDVYGAERGWLVGHVASLRRDWLTLWSMAETHAYRFEDRLGALLALERQRPIESERLRRGYEDLFRELPESEALRRQFAHFLEREIGKRHAARNVLLPLLAARPASDPESNELAGQIARLYLKDKNPEEAWALLEPRLDQPAVQLQAVRAQLALGDAPRAESIARAAHERHPTSPQIAAELAAVLWESCRPDEAARLIATFPRGTVDDADRCWSCRAFVRIFRGEPSADAETAFRALLTAQVDAAVIEGTLDTLRSGGMPDTAFALGDLLAFEEASLAAHLATYESVKDLRGEAQAIAWAVAKVPRDRRADAATAFYAAGADELLWTLYTSLDPNDPQAEAADAPWLLRAAAFAREREPSPEHRAALLAWFGARQETQEERLGAALVGLLEPDDVLASALTEAELDQAAYFLGARAESARDYRGALRMYQLALEDPQRTPGRELADAALRRIQATKTSPDALAAERSPRAILAAGR